MNSSRHLTRQRLRKILSSEQGAKRGFDDQLKLREDELRSKTLKIASFESELAPLRAENNTLKDKMASLYERIQQLFQEIENTKTITKYIDCITLSDCNETSLAASILANISSFGTDLMTRTPRPRSRRVSHRPPAALPRLLQLETRLVEQVQKRTRKSREEENPLQQANPRSRIKDQTYCQQSRPDEDR